MPEPDDLLADVQTLDRWVRELRARQAAITARPVAAAAGE
jgi:hypothetical protein